MKITVSSLHPLETALVENGVKKDYKVRHADKRISAKPFVGRLVEGYDGAITTPS